MARLYEFAVEKTRDQKRRVRNFSDLGSRLSVSAQTVNNWKTRGLSKDGALAAEREFGCSADWLLHGDGARVVVPQTPPRLNERFADNRTPTPSEWAMIDNIRAYPPELRQARMDEIAAEAEKWRTFRDQVIAEIKGKP